MAKIYRLLPTRDNMDRIGDDVIGLRIAVHDDVLYKQ